MTWLLRWTALLSTSILLLISGSVLMGRAMPAREPNRLAAYGGAVCDGRPCFAGVVPGLTAQDAPALQRLRQDANCLSNNSICYFVVAENVRGMYASSTQETLTLFSDQRVFSFRVHELIDLYGDPCGIDVGFYNLQYRLLFPYAEAQGILESDRRLRPSSKVEHVQLLEINPCEYEIIPWRGFITIDRYREVFATKWVDTLP